MRFIGTTIEGVYVIDVEPQRDQRGSFARVFDADLFAQHGLVTHFPQHSISVNAQRGTLRGLHYQEEPHAECKVVRCVSGAVYDVAVDIRPRSPGFGRWFAVELTAENHRALYLPVGVAHGFQTLADGVAVMYLIDRPYVPSARRGIVWDDPDLAIAWPIRPPAVLSDRDRALPRLRQTIGRI